jgi:uncharacterized protein (TIGR03435 family)
VVRKVLGAFLSLLLTAESGAAQNGPAFEVASVRRNVSGSRKGSSQLRPGGRLVVVNENLRSVIRDAYGQGRLEVVGGPTWVDTEAWDIVATAGREVSDEEVWAMLRTLLEQRFKLVARRQTREQPIYALVPASSARNGPQMHESSTACPASGNSCGTQSATGRVIGTAAEMSDLVRALSRVAGRSVVDKTGSTGRFDFTLTWTPEAAGTLTPTSGTEGGSLFTAIQEQLNLKLVSQRGPVDLVVVDRAEPASDD